MYTWLRIFGYKISLRGSDAFGHAHGRPTYEPNVNSGTDASDGEGQIQKACRLIESTHTIDEGGEYYRGNQLFFLSGFLSGIDAKQRKNVVVERRVSGS